MVETKSTKYPSKTRYVSRDQALFQAFILLMDETHLDGEVSPHEDALQVSLKDALHS